MLEFLAVLLIVCAILIWHVEVLAFIVTMWVFFRNLHGIAWIYAHPLKLALYVSAYFLIGALWSVVKWWFDETERVRETKVTWAKYHPSMTWEEYIRTEKSDPNSFAHKGEFMTWIMWWPFSMLFTLLNDPLTRLCRRISHELKMVYQRITDHVWKG